MCLTYLQGLLVQVGLVEGNVHGVAGGHHVVIVDDLSKKWNLTNNCRDAPDQITDSRPARYPAHL